MLWDIFCKVIDNHGDIGVCWRLSVQLAERGHAVRLWADDASALQWMAPEGHEGIEVRPWNPQTPAAEPGDAVIEAFGCELDTPFQAAIAARTRRLGRQPVWINLEYLTAESFAERSHGLPSPVMAGPAAGLTKHFFYPGFTMVTGGLLREADLMDRQARFNATQWLHGQGIDTGEDARRVSLFCYEPPALAQLLAQWARAARRTHLLVTHGRAAAAVRAAIDANDRMAPGWNSPAQLAVSLLPLLTQRDYDHLLWSCDLNFVRGEDSLVRAIWAGQPFVWNIYPQDDDAHHAKLSAFLDWLAPPRALRDFHTVWNRASSGPLPTADAPAWAGCISAARQRLLAQEDLVTQLLAFAASQSASP